MPNDGVPRMLVSFVCGMCKARTSRLCKKATYQKGIVIMQCSNDDCKKWHLMSDHLQWFMKDGFKVEDLMSEKGLESVKELIGEVKARKSNAMPDNHPKPQFADLEQVLSSLRIQEVDVAELQERNRVRKERKQKQQEQSPHDGA